MFLRQFKTAKALLLLAASLSVSGCGTKIGIQIEKVLNSPDSIVINDGAKYTQVQNLEIHLSSLHSFYSLSESEVECSEKIPSNFIINNANVSKTGLANKNNIYWAKYYSLDGDHSECLSASILIDNAEPVISSLSYDPTSMTAGDVLKSPKITWDSIKDAHDGDGSGLDFSGIDYYELSIYPVDNATKAIDYSLPPLFVRKVYETLLNPLPMTTAMDYTLNLSGTGESFDPGKSYKAVIRAYDKAGNFSARRESNFWSLDSTAPSISEVIIASDDISACSATYKFAKDSLTTSPSIKITATDDSSGLKYALISLINLNTNSTIVTDTKVNFSSAAGVQLADILTSTVAGGFAHNGKYKISVKVVDYAGNISAPFVSPDTWIVDTKSDALVSETFGTIPTSSNLSTIPQGLSYPSLNLTNELISSSTVPTYKVVDKDDSTKSTLLVVTSTAQTISPGFLEDGHRYFLKAVATDCLAHTSEVSSSGFWIQDNTNPILDSATPTAKIGSLVFTPGNTSAVPPVPAKLSFNLQSGSDPVPAGGTYVSGISKYSYRFIKDGDINASGNNATTEVWIDAATLASASGAISGINASSLVTGDYKVEVKVKDNAGNLSSSYISTNFAHVSNTPPTCTFADPFLPLLSGSVASKVTVGSIEASKNTLNTLKVNFTNIDCFDPATPLIKISKYNVLLKNEAGDDVFSTSLNSPATKIYEKLNLTGSEVLTSGKKYKFVVNAEDAYGRTSNGIESGLWLVDSTAPADVANINLANVAYYNNAQNAGENSPSIRWDLGSDKPVVSAGVYNVGVTDYSVAVYKATNAAGVLPTTPVQVLEFTGITAQTYQFTNQATDSFKDGNFYTSRVLAKDALGNISANYLTAGSIAQTWLVDKTAPVFLGNPFSGNVKQNTDLTNVKIIASFTANTGNAVENDPTPTGVGVGTNVSGLDKFKMYFAKVNTATNNIDTYPTVTEILASNDFVPGSNNVSFSPPASYGVYRAVAYLVDKAGNISLKYESNNFVFSSGSPNCGSSSLAYEDFASNDPLKMVAVSSTSPASKGVNFDNRTPTIDWNGVVCTSDSGLALTYKLEIAGSSSISASIVNAQLSKSITISGTASLNKGFFDSLVAYTFPSGSMYYPRVVVTDGVFTTYVVGSTPWFVDKSAPDAVSGIQMATTRSYINASDIANGFNLKTKSFSWNGAAVSDAPSAPYNVGGIGFNMYAYETSRSATGVYTLAGTLNSVVNPSGVTAFTGNIQLPGGSPFTFQTGKNYSVVVKAYDQLGNLRSLSNSELETGFSDKNSFLVDTTLPTLGSLSNLAFYSISKKIAFTLTAGSDGGINPSGFDKHKIQITYDSGGSGAPAFNTIYDISSNSVSLSTDIANNKIVAGAKYKVTLIGYDVAGNSTSSDVGFFTMLSAPSVEIIQVYNQTDMSKTAVLPYLAASRNAIAVKGTCSESGTVNLYLSTAPASSIGNFPCTSANTTSSPWSVNVNLSALALGYSGSIVAKITNTAEFGAGISYSSNSVNIVVPGAPTLTLAAATTDIGFQNRDAFPITGVCSAYFNTSSSYTVSFVIKNSGGTVVSAPASQTVNCVKNVSSVDLTPSSIDFDFSGVPDGNYTLVGTFTDDYSQKATSNTLNLKLDTSLKILSFALTQASTGTGSSAADRYVVGVSSNFSGTCDRAGSVQIYLLENSSSNPGTFLEPPSVLPTPTTPAPLLPVSNTVKVSSPLGTISCVQNGSAYEFAGTFDFSGNLLSKYFALGATLKVSSVESTKYKFVFAKTSFVSIPWAAEKDGSMTFTKSYAADPGIIDLDEYQDSIKSPTIIWGETKNASGIGSITRFKVILAQDVNDNYPNPLVPPTLATIAASGTPYRLISQKIVSGSATNTAQFTGVSLDDSHYYVSCVVAVDASDIAISTLRCSDGFIINNLCPRGFVHITDPGGNSAKNFCVSKYEMTISSGNLVPANNSLSSSIYDILGNAPELDQTTSRSGADTKCKGMDTSGSAGGYGLITNIQWNTIASIVSYNLNNVYNPSASNGFKEISAGDRTSIKIPVAESASYTPVADGRILQIDSTGSGSYIHDFSGGRAELVNNTISQTSSSSFQGYQPSGQLDCYFWSASNLSSGCHKWLSEGYNPAIRAVVNSTNVNGGDLSSIYNFGSTSNGAASRGTAALIRGGGIQGGTSWAASGGIFGADAADGIVFGEWKNTVGFRCVSKPYAPSYHGM